VCLTLFLKSLVCVEDAYGEMDNLEICSATGLSIM
jgi:hypothetical protein